MIAANKRMIPAVTVVLLLYVPMAPSPLKILAVLFSDSSSPLAALSIFSSFTSIITAGIRLKLISLITIVPKAINMPKTFTGMICIIARTPKPAAVARAVYFTGWPTTLIVSNTACLLFFNSLNLK